MTRLALVAFVALAAGCGLLKGRFPRIHPEPPTFSQYHLDGWAWQGVDRVLVLPFLNESPHTRAGDEMRAAFTSQLQREGRWEVISAPADDRAVLAAQIHRNGRFDEAAMLALSQQTGADVIVHGIVTHYSPYPRPRMGLILQAVSPQEAKVVGSVDGLWDTTDAAVAERCRIYYRQAVHPRPPLLRNNRIVDDDSFAGEIALDSPALFQRWVAREAILALQGKPVPGVVSLKAKSCVAATDGAILASQPACGPEVTTASGGKVK
jgi:hypothetical protein